MPKYCRLYVISEPFLLIFSGIHVKEVLNLLEIMNLFRIWWRHIFFLQKCAIHVFIKLQGISERMYEMSWTSQKKNGLVSLLNGTLEDLGGWLYIWPWKWNLSVYWEAYLISIAECFYSNEKSFHGLIHPFDELSSPDLSALTVHMAQCLQCK